MTKCNKKNKKKLKDEELESILEQFDDFQIDDNKKENIERRLLTYIPYANRVIQQYENTRHKYLSLNVSFLAAISFFLPFFFTYFKPNSLQQFLIISGSFLSAFLIVVNLLFNLRKNPIHTLPQTTFWFYKDNVPDGRKKLKPKEIRIDFQNRFHRTEKEFIREDLKQLFTLYLYQERYANSAITTRINFLVVVLVFFIPFFISIMTMPFFN